MEKKTIKKEIIKSAINIALLLSKTIYGLGVQTQAHAHTHIQYTIEAENEIVVKWYKQTYRLFKSSSFKNDNKASHIQLQEAVHQLYLWQ